MSASLSLDPLAHNADDSGDDADDADEREPAPAAAAAPATPAAIHDDDEDKEEDEEEDEAEKPPVKTEEKSHDAASSDEEDEAPEPAAKPVAATEKPAAKTNGVAAAATTVAAAAAGASPAKTPVKGAPAQAGKVGRPRKSEGGPAQTAKRHQRQGELSLSRLAVTGLRTSQLKRLARTIGFRFVTGASLLLLRDVMLSVQADIVHGAIRMAEGGNRATVSVRDVAHAIRTKLGDQAALYECEDLPSKRKLRRKTQTGPRLPSRTKTPASVAKRKVKSAPTVARVPRPVKKPRKEPAAAAAAAAPMEADEEAQMAAAAAGDE
jgi:histone H3/H4